MDATLAGIKAAKGSYLCFLDPDDRLGEDFVQTLMDEMTDSCDFVAAGFYKEKNGVISAYPLAEDRYYSAEALREYSDCYLCEPGKYGISNRFFNSRCNKLYTTELVRKTAEHFQECKGISLGEDSTFTFIMLQFARGGKTLKKPNTYYYDVGIPNSMMKSDQVDTYLKKCNAAFSALHSMTERFGRGSSQPYALYYFLVNALMERLLNGDREPFCQLYRFLQQDEKYLKGKRVANSQTSKGLAGVEQKLYNMARTPEQYLVFRKFLKFVRRILRSLKR